MFPAVLISVGAAIGLIFGLLAGTTVGISKVQLPPKPRPVILDLTQPGVTPKTLDDVTQVAKEMDEWRQELTEQRNQNIQQDADLIKREQLVRAERDALTRERQRVISLTQELETQIIRIKDSEAPKLQELADLYTTMKPEEAQQILRARYNDSRSDVVKIMSKMRPKIQAKVISAWLKSAGNNDLEKNIVAEITVDMKKITTSQPPSALNDASMNNAPLNDLSPTAALPPEAPSRRNPAFE
jgi:flagellar motility protein MotE (MotC chaperone)